MVVELPLIFFVAAHFCHLFQSIEHCLHDLVIGTIDELSNLQCIRPNELGLNATNIRGEKLDERCDSFPFLACQLCFLYRFDLVVLRRNQSPTTQLEVETSLTTRLSKSALRRMCCFSRAESKNVFPRSSASD